MGVARATLGIPCGDYQRIDQGRFPAKGVGYTERVIDLNWTHGDKEFVLEKNREIIGAVISLRLSRPGLVRLA